jgi:hypothetical protein
VGLEPRFRYSPFLQTLEEVRLCVEHCAPSVEFLGFFKPTREQQTFIDDNLWIEAFVLFAGRKLSFCVTCYTDCFVGLHVGDLDGRNKPRAMPLHERDWQICAKILLALEGDEVESVHTNELISLFDNLGRRFMTIA